MNQWQPKRQLTPNTFEQRYTDESGTVLGWLHIHRHTNTVYCNIEGRNTYAYHGHDIEHCQAWIENELSEDAERGLYWALQFIAYENRPTEPQFAAMAAELMPVTSGNCEQRLRAGLPLLGYTFDNERQQWQRGVNDNV